MNKKLLLIICLAATTCAAQHYDANWQSLDKRPVPQWYKDVKFGIFIHWGVYSVPAFTSKGNYAEWYQHALTEGDSATVKFNQQKFGTKTYYQFADEFKAELFNPDEWADLFEKSGAKYIVLTSKHHDGFANWPSKEASKTWGFPWNAVDAGPHRDLLGDLFTAVRKTSVHAGMYYSLYEWYNPLWLKDKARYVTDHEWPQMKDLINTYKPDVFWTDGEWEASDTVWKSTEFLSWLYNESPVKNKVVTYDRWGSSVRFHHGGVYTPEYQPDLDFEDHYWEESRGMGFSYGYNRNEDAWDYNSAQSLVLQLIDKVSRGGNFLLDIGPDAHGKIPPIMQERLLQIGDWLKLNGESIYSTQRWRNASQWSGGKRDYVPKNGGGDLLLKLTIDPDSGYAVKEAFFTYNSSTNNLYAILPKWPAAGVFRIHDLAVQPGTRVQLLETHDVLTWEQDGSDVTIHFPSYDPNRIKANYAFVVKIPNTGRFAAKPKVLVDYPKDAQHARVAIGSRDSLLVHYTMDGSVPTLHSPTYQEPFIVDSSCNLNVRAFAKTAMASDVAKIPVHVYNWKPARSGVKVKPQLALAKYILSNPVSTDEMNSLTPVKKKLVSTISINDTLRREQSGLIYSGMIKIPKDGVYAFQLSSDDGSRLSIDEELVINNDGLHGGGEMEGKVALKKGLHNFRLAYFQATGGATLHLSCHLPAESKHDIPSNWFYHQAY